MQAHELAKSAGVDSKEIVELLGLDSHMSKVSDEGIATVVAKYEIEGLTQEAPEKQSREGIARLWSENRVHRVMATNGKVITMDDFQLTVKIDSDIYREIKKSMDSEIRVVVDEPFKSVSARTAFRNFLTDRCVTDQGKQSLNSGLDWLKGLFFPSELEEVAELLQESAGIVGVIQLAVDTKSYKAL